MLTFVQARSTSQGSLSTPRAELQRTFTPPAPSQKEDSPKAKLQGRSLNHSGLPWQNEERGLKTRKTMPGREGAQRGGLWSTAPPGGPGAAESSGRGSRADRGGSKMKAISTA